MDAAAYLEPWLRRGRIERDAIVRREKQARAALPTLVRLLVDRFGATRVTLVGSLGRGTFQRGSDIDLLVEGLTLDAALAAWSEAMDLAKLPVDLIRAETVSPAWREHFERWGQVLHAV
jgi:predicted nucleotidyltransferase